MVKPAIDFGLENLLQLHGEVFPMDNGFWVKFEVYTIDPSNHIPHGIRYSPTLHDKFNRRILGYDNAHAVKPRKGNRFAGRREIWDHKHQKATVYPYEFTCAGQLLEDFWRDVNKIID